MQLFASLGVSRVEHSLSWSSLDEEVAVVLVCDVVAVVVALHVANQRLEVEVRQLKLVLEQDVLEELIVKFGRAR